MVDFKKASINKGHKHVADDLNTSENWSVKHRPRTLKDLYGQESLVKEIQGMFLRKDVPASILISGPTGCGKTSVSRILAKMVNGFDLTRDSYPDIIETDVADERKIDDVRSMVSSTKFLPQEGKYKVYILDEIHALTSQAASAVLKSLEEPMPHVKWVLATNEPNRLLPTIRGRCYPLTVRPLTEDNMVELLNAVCEKEEVFQPAKKYVRVIREVARAAGGESRSALQILHKLANFDRASPFDSKDKDSYTAALHQAFRDMDMQVEKVAVKVLISLYKSKKTAVTSLADTQNYSALAMHLLNYNTYLIERACGGRGWPNFMTNLLVDHIKDKEPTLEQICLVQENLITLRQRVLMATTSDRQMMISGMANILVQIRAL